MKDSRFIKFLVAAILFALILTGCGGGPIQASSWPGISVSGDTLYVAFNEFVRAIDLETERELWRYPAEADRSITFYAPPAVSEDGMLVLGSYDQKIYGLSTAKGRPETIWVFEESADRIIGGPVIHGEIALIPSADNKLYALDLNSGQPVWDQPFESKHALWSAPLVDDDMIYLASLDHSIYALGLSHGQLKWSSDLGSAISDTPTLSDGLILCGTFEGLLFALDKKSGREVWRFETGAPIWGNPVVDDGVVYVADVDGDAFALNLQNGAEIWRKTLSSSASTSPITNAERVFFVSETGKVEAFEKASGDPSWPSGATLLGRLLADPVIVNDELLVPVMDSTECIVFGVNTETGSTRCVVPQDES